MNGIPGNLMGPLKETLRRCDVFDSDLRLQNVFTDQRLYLWRDELHDADNRPKRVENLISTLVELYRSDDSENALLIFLQVLAERYKQDDVRHEQLNALANTLKWCLDPPTPLATNHTTLQAHLQATQTQNTGNIKEREERPAPLSTNHTSPQANPQAAQMQETVSLETMLARTRSVAHIKLQLYRNGKKSELKPSTGTGWLIAPGIVATCWHMVTGQMAGQEPSLANEDLQLQIQNMLFIFDYLSADRGTAYKIAELLFPLHDDQSCITDYALLRLKDREDFPLRHYQPLPLELDPQLTSQSLLYIIQHPLGDPQRIAYDTFEQESSWPGRIHYHTPTEKGTSGAPILNALNWHVIGLHNGEDQEANLREGTLISSILEDLRDKRPEIWKEIIEYHNIQLSTDPLSPSGEDVHMQPATSPPTHETLVPAEVHGFPTDSPALNGNSIDTSSAIDQPAPQLKGNIKSQPFDVLKKYQDEFSNELRILRSAQKLFSLPILTHRNRRRVYSDECKGLLKELDTLEKLMQKYAAFFKQIEAISPFRCQISLERIHHFQSLMKELCTTLASFCSSNSEASYEEQNNFHQQIKNILKIGNKIKKDSMYLLNALGKSSSVDSIQLMEGQVP